MSDRRPLVGWYVHHQGAGHRTRFDVVRAQLDADVVVFSTLAQPTVLPAHTRWTMLDRDDQVERTESGAPRDPSASDPTAGGALHWAPLGHSGHASRLGMIAADLASERFDAFVVDVSVEVTLLVRLFGVPAVVMTQPGERDDDPHRLAFTAASRIVAPWAEELYVPRALEPFRAKTAFVGGISRFAGRRVAAAAPGVAGAAPAVAGAAPVAAAAGAAPVPAGSPASAEAPVAAAPLSVLVLGAGGSRAVTPAYIEAAAVATKGGSTWHALGMESTPHVSAERWNADPFDLLRQADVVVSFAGQNAVADLAAVGARAIVIPQPRPFDEQRATADVLHSAGLAVTPSTWPAPEEWPALLAEARASTPDWSRWRVPGAAARAAGAIAEVARPAAGGDPHPGSLRSGTALAPADATSVTPRQGAV